MENICEKNIFAEVHFIEKKYRKKKVTALFRFYVYDGGKKVA
jgi:hypothetical protein